VVESFFIGSYFSDRANTGTITGGTLTTGHVVSTEVPECGRACSYRATVEFQAQPCNCIVQFKSIESGSRQRIGAPVKVVYKPTDPRQAHDVSLHALVYQVPVGVVMILAGLMLGYVEIWRGLLRTRWRGSGWLASG
jgi:hypothetical protein